MLRRKKILAMILVFTLIVQSLISPWSSTSKGAENDTETPVSPQNLSEAVNMNESSNIKAVSGAAIDTATVSGAAVDISAVSGTAIDINYLEYQTDRYIIKYKNASGSSSLKKYLKTDIKESKKLKNKNNQDIEVIELNKKVKPEVFIEDLKKNNKVGISNTSDALIASKVDNETYKDNSDNTSGYILNSEFDFDTDIEYIQPDYEFTSASADPLYDEQWGIENTTTDAQSVKETSELSGAYLAENPLAAPGFPADNSAGQPEDISDADTDSTLPDLASISGIGSWWMGNNSEMNDNTYRVDAEVTDAWALTKGAGVTVAVIDSGIDLTQEDLRDNIFINSGEIPGNQIDDDGNGYIDDVNGWNFVDKIGSVHNQEKITDEWHGTHIAGIIAAQEDNNAGITGVAPDAKIMPLKVFENGIAYTSDIIAAIEYAESMGVKIVNCSWGSAANNPALKEAIDNSDMLFVCAAGNNLVNIDNSLVYPAAYDNSNILSVASVNSDGILSSFSNYGEASVDVAAPGDNIISTAPDNRYMTSGGTSMAAAFASGEAALILSLNRDFDVARIRERILVSSDRLSSLTGKTGNGYKINCSNAVQNIVPEGTIIIDSVDYNNYSTGSTPVLSDYSLYGTGTWTTKANYPAYEFGLRAAVLNGQIYTTGGFYNNSVYQYNAGNNSWIQKASMLNKRFAHAMAVVNGKIYVIGGLDNNYAPINSVEEYDPATNTWTLKANMPTARSGVAVAVVNNIIYVFGGSNGSSDLNTVEAYNPETNTWTVKTSMISARYNPGATALNGKIYAAGGKNSNTMEMYDPLANTWAMKTSMPTPRYSLALEGANGKLYAIGGYGTSSPCNTVEEYSPVTNSWSSCPGMPVAKGDFGAASLNNRIYIIAGYNNGASYNAMNCYTPAADDYGDDFNNAMTISVGSTISGTINYAGDNDYFKFVAPQSRTYTIYTSGNIDSIVEYIYDSNGRIIGVIPPGTMESYIYLYDSNGVQIAENSSSCNGTYNLSIIADLQEGNTYYIKMKIISTLGTGCYYLSVNKMVFAPAGLHSVSNPGNITIAWSAAANATGYDIEIDGKAYDCGTSLTYIHNNPSQNVAHVYRVRSKEGTIVSGWSNYTFAAAWGSVWQIKSNMPISGGLGTAVINGKIYAVSGKTLEMYDPLADIWSAKANMQVNRNKPGIVALNGKLYAIGGYNVLSSVEEYNPDTNTWSMKAAMSTSRYALGVAVLNGKIYAAGGSGGMNKLEVYDPVTNTWTTKADMPTGRYALTLTAVNNKLYAIGGLNGSNQLLNTVEEYDPVTDTWKTKAAMPTAKYYMSTAAVYGKIYVTGGNVTSGYSDTVEVYSPEADTWTSMGAKLIRSGTSGAAFYNNKLYIFGGYSGYGNLPTIEILDLGKQAQYIYDSNGRLVEVKNFGVSIAIYNYDKNGNLLSIQTYR